MAAVQHMMSMMLLVMFHVAPSWSQTMAARDKSALMVVRGAIENFPAVTCDYEYFVCDDSGRVTDIYINLGMKGKIAAEIGNLTKLIRLDLTYNQLSGIIPSAIGRLVSLNSLWLSNNQLTGSIPSSIGQLVELRELELDNNRLSGSIPWSIGQLKKLQILHFNNNKLVGNIPWNFGQLTSLLELDLSTNELTASVQSSIGQLTSLQGLWLGKNKLTGSIPSSIGQWKSLKYLWLSNNQLSGKIPSSIGQLVELVELYLHANSLSGVIPSSIGQLTKLEKLWLDDNQLSGSIPSSIGLLTSLQELYLNYNFLNGSIPSSIDRMESLQYLYLNDNYLSGIIPSSISQLTSLYGLYLSNNQLSGSIPTSIGERISLKCLFISNNQLSGSIPSSIIELTELQELWLDSNQLSGSIPVSIGQMGKLQKIYLGNNQLSGNIPSSIGQLTSLQNFNISSNYITGPIFKGNGHPSCDELGSNCLFGSNLPFGCGSSDQKRKSDCQVFCNSTQVGGPCGGGGACSTSSDGKTPRCACYPGYNNQFNKYNCLFVPVPPSPPPFQGNPGTGFNDAPSSGPTMKNKFFRYLSAGYLFLNKATPPSWLVATRWNWVDAVALQAIKDQQICNTCWLFATTSAIESAYFLSMAGQVLVPSIPEEQFLVCSGQNKSCNDGGSPTDALNYASMNRLVLKEGYSGAQSCNNPKPTSSIRIRSFDEVQSHGWVGLLLAVNQQPAIVSVEGSSSSFINYQNGIFEDDDCFSSGVDHNVVVVGYDLTYSPPFWVIRNSWGTSWGESGYMRVKITGGLGICGINSLPALVPIIQSPPNDPCNTFNFASNMLNNDNGPGRFNPCGNGKCIPMGAKNLCQCNNTFVAVNNSDGSQTCAPASPCTFNPRNPCGTGTCLDSSFPPGTYACICPPGYALDSQSGPLTCISDGSLPVKKFLVPNGVTVTCYDLYLIYGINKDVFLSQNKGINCSVPLLPNTIIDVTSSKNCSLLYAVNENDTCAKISSLFEIKNLAGPGSPNPDLDCLRLRPFQQVCIKRGAPPFFGPCTYPYDVKPYESCFSIISNQLDGNYSRFYELNPGVFCGRLLFVAFQNGNFGQQVCLNASDMGSRLKGCLGKPYTLKVGDSCSKLSKCYTKKEPFKKMNKFPCRKAALQKVLKSPQKKICIPKSSTCK